MSNETIAEQAPVHPQHALVVGLLTELETMLLSRDPAMKGHLKQIHTNLIQYEELVHLLKDEEIGTLMAAQQQMTDTLLFTEVKAASKRKNSSAAAKLTISDL